MTFFAAGIISALGALFLELFFSLFKESFSAFSFFGVSFFFFLAVIIEEFLKLIFIKKLLEEKIKIKNPAGKIFFFGLGFSLLEIVMNIFKNGGLKIPMLLSYSGVFLIHIAAALIIGWFILAKNKNFFWTIAGFSMAIFIHFLYNLSILRDYNHYLLITVIFILSLFFFEKINRAVDSC